MDLPGMLTMSGSQIPSRTVVRGRMDIGRSYLFGTRVYTPRLLLSEYTL